MSQTTRDITVRHVMVKVKRKKSSRQHGHVSDASTADTDKLCCSDALLRDCFDAGQRMFVSTLSVNTQDKSLQSKSTGTHPIL